MAEPIVPTFDYLKIDLEPTGGIRVHYIIKDSEINYRSIIVGKSEIEASVIESIQNAYKLIYEYYDSTQIGEVKEKYESSRKIASMLFNLNTFTVFFTKKNTLSSVSTKLRDKGQPFRNILYSAIGSGFKTYVENNIIINIDTLSKAIVPGPKPL